MNEIKYATDNMPRDLHGAAIQTWTPIGGMVVVADTEYTSATLVGTVLKFSEDTTVTMSDGVEVPYLAGDTFGIVTEETYTFGTGQTLGVM